MIAATVANRGAFLKLATDAAALDADLRGVIRDLAREWLAQSLRPSDSPPASPMP